MNGMFHCRCGAAAATRTQFEFHLDVCPDRVIRVKVGGRAHRGGFFHRLIEWVLG